MTLKFMEGFETCADDTDFRARGWVGPSTALRVGFPTSITNVSGTSMHLIGAGNSATTANGAGVDIGYYNLGVTINQAWLAGGFSYGVGMKFNSQLYYTYGNAGGDSFFNQLAYDSQNALYWSARYVSGGTPVICTSPDLINWTPIATTPATISTQISFSYLGNGVVALMGVNVASTTPTLYYTNNNGASWSSNTLFTAGASGIAPGFICTTGNSTYPYVAIAGARGASATSGGVVVGSLGGTWTRVASYTTTTSSNTAVMVSNNGFLIGCSSSGSNWYINNALTSSDISQTASWGTATFANSSAIADCVFNPTTNAFIIATSTGIWTVPAGGSVGSPAIVTGAVTATSRYSTVGMNRIFLVGSTYYALGAAGHIITSPDGVTWTETAGHLILPGSTYAWRGAIYDGTQYVLLSDYTSGIIAVTPDLSTKYVAKYVADFTEVTQSTNFYGRTGIYLASAAPTSAGAFTVVAGEAALFVQAPASGARPVSIAYASAVASRETSVNVSTTSLYHYYEVVATATSTANTFLLNLYVDGSLVFTGTTGRLLGSSTTDTTSLMVWSWDRYANTTAWDDMYFLLNDGSGMSGPQGILNIVARRPSTDVQAQWVKAGTAASNSLSVRQRALSSLSTNSVSSATAGDKDIYTSSDTIPAGYSVKAVQLEGAFTQTSTTNPTVNLGVISNSVEKDGTNLTLTTQGTTVVTTSLFEKDPSGNAWTTATATAAEIVLNHVT